MSINPQTSLRFLHVTQGYYTENKNILFYLTQEGRTAILPRLIAQDGVTAKNVNRGGNALH